jgi:hypothetical protein
MSAVTLDNPTAIQKYALMVLAASIGLEARGMKRRGRSATSIARERLGMPKATRDQLIAKLKEMAA